MEHLEVQENRATDIINFLRDLPNRSRWSFSLIQAQIESLHESWRRFRRRHDKLLKETNLRNQPYFVSRVFETTHRSYRETLGFLYDQQARLQTSAPSAQGVPGPMKRAHLPKLRLPIFSGLMEDWEPFRDLFLSLVHEDASLSAVEKLHFLKTSVEGPARKALDSLDVTEVTLPGRHFSIATTTSDTESLIT